METSGTDMLNDSDNRAPISPLHLAVSAQFFSGDSSSGGKQLLHRFIHSGYFQNRLIKINKIQTYVLIFLNEVYRMIFAFHLKLASWNSFHVESSN